MSKNILVIAAHPDDEALGCGGAIARHTENKDKVGVVFIADGVGARNHLFEESLLKRKKSAEKALKILGAENLGHLDFPDNKLDTIPLLDIIKEIEITIKEFKPSIVYTHHYGDLNIDHSIASKAAITACRPHPNSTIESILFFEVPSSTYWGFSNDFFKPNYYIDISSYSNTKKAALQEYALEMKEYPNYRSFEVIQALGVYRGGQIGAQHAEAFELFREIKR